VKKDEPIGHRGYSVERNPDFLNGIRDKPAVRRNYATPLSIWLVPSGAPIPKGNYRPLPAPDIHLLVNQFAASAFYQ